jgi:hypothetical protein
MEMLARRGIKSLGMMRDWRVDLTSTTPSTAQGLGANPTAQSVPTLVSPSLCIPMPTVSCAERTCARPVAAVVAAKLKFRGETSVGIRTTRSGCG